MARMWPALWQPMVTGMFQGPIGELLLTIGRLTGVAPDAELLIYKVFSDV